MSAADFMADPERSPPPDLRSNAIHAFRAGLLPFPAKNKKTLVSWQRFEVPAARPDEDWVASAFRRRPKATEHATLTGAATNVVVLEADTTEDYEKLSRCYPSPWRTKSRRGGHVYFQIPDTFSDEDASALRCAQGRRLRLPDGEVVEVDVKAHGGLATLPGSIHETGHVYTADGSAPWPWTLDQREALPSIDPTWVFLVGIVPMTLRELMDRHLRPPPMPVTERRNYSSGDVRGRVQKYLAKCPPAVSGQGGRKTTFSIVCQVVRGFDLDDDTAFDLLSEWNDTCQPPWTERELRAEIRGARKAKSPAIGSKLVDQRERQEHRWRRRDREEACGGGQEQGRPREREPGDDEDEPRERPRKPLPQLPEDLRLRMTRYGKDHSDAKRVLRLARCCTVEMIANTGHCEGDIAPTCSWSRPCGFTTCCPYCSYRFARIIKEGAKERWECERCVVARWPVAAGDRDALKRERKRVIAAHKKVGVMAPFWFEGYSHVLTILPSSEAALAAYREHFADAEWEEVDAAEAGRRAAEAWLEPTRVFEARWVHGHEMIAALEVWPWFREKHQQRYNGSKEAREKIRVETMDQWRTRRREESDEPSPDQCKICKKKRSVDCFHTPTGIMLQSGRQGFASERDVEKMLDNSDAEDRWLAANHERLFAVSTPSSPP